MKVLHLRASNFYGGPERQLHFHARLARENGIDITISSFLENNKKPQFLEIIEKDGIPIHAFDVVSAYDRSAVAKLAIYLKENKTDILCTHDYRTHLIGLLARKKAGVKWVAFSRGWTWENFKIKMYHTLDKIIIRRADHIVAVSSAQKDKLTRLFISGKKIGVVLNAIDPGYFEKIEPVNLAKKYNLPKESYIVVSGGRFSREKGQIFLVEALMEAITKDNQIRGILYGDGPDREMLKKLVQEKIFENKIIFPGFESNLSGHLKGADALVNPSLSEGLPNIILEAMALGVVVVASAVGGVPEIIRDNYNGYLVEPKNSGAISDRLLNLKNDNKTAQNFILKAKETITKDFSFTEQNHKLTAIYQKVLAE